MKISEHFYSIQGEGVTVGMPAYFIRLGGCNLMCGGPKGSLVKQGKATWWCDSETIWRNSKDVSNEDLVASMKKQGVFEDIIKGNVNVVWTGGEPTLEKHVSDIMDFIDYIDDEYDNDMFCEIETNGTKVPSEFFYKDYIQLINCSPKLANSGVPEDKRIVPAAINNILKQKMYCFKFVVSTEDDIKEFERDFVKPYKIPMENIVIMPGVDNREDLPERTRFIFEMTKKYKYRSVTRQHILAYNRTTGV